MLVLPTFGQSNRYNALVTTGGVSLGVYEAGFLYESIKSLRRDGFNEKDGLIFTGASAGALNSFIAILESCSLENKKLEDSIFWNSWIDLDFDNFYTKNKSRSTSILSRSSLDNVFDTLAQQWKLGLKKGCRSFLGVTVTRKEPLSFLQKEELNFPRTTESFYLEIIGQGKDIEPQIKNYNLKNGSIQTYLPFSEKNNFNILKSVLLSSSSFPIAFEPTEIKHCLIYPTKTKKCSKENSRSDLFIDGGIFNNAPLDLAYRFSKALKREKVTSFIFFDPEIKNYPQAKEGVFSNFHDGILKDSMKFIKNFVSSSRSGQVANFIGQHPEIEKNLTVLKGDLPLASEPLSGFFGFFEKDFRKFDFYLGMANARTTFTQSKNQKLTFNKKFKSEQEAFINCYIAAINNDKESLEFCTKTIRKGLENSAILFRVSIERLFSNCSYLDKSIKIENKLCLFAREGKSPKEFYGEWPNDWRRKAEEPLVDYIMRRLEFYRFEFKDLKLRKDQASMGIVKIKQKLNRAIELASSNQSKDDKFLFSWLSSPLLNYIFYSPVPIETYAMLGNNTLELGQSRATSTYSLTGHFWRYSYGLNLNGLDLLEKEGKLKIGVVPHLGIQFEPQNLSSPTWQHRFGLRLGYQFSSENDWELNQCNSSDRFSQSFPLCSTWIAQAVASSTLFETVKIQLLYQRALKKNQFDKAPTYLSLLMGLQF